MPLLVMTLSSRASLDRLLVVAAGGGCERESLIASDSAEEGSGDEIGSSSREDELQNLRREVRFDAVLT